jgi:hypothetical protein
VRVLVACEFSGVVRDAFQARGHRAYSCDLIPSSKQGGHYTGDVRRYLDVGWDLMIAFPPCTYLARSGNRWANDPNRQMARGLAIHFVQTLMDAPIPRIAIENPVGVLSTAIRKPDQIVHPWQFGHPEDKSTCLWLKNLPLLTSTNIVHDRGRSIHFAPDSKDRSRRRSITFTGIADAMAEQWGSL